MLVTVKAGADPERVREALVARGLWVETLRDGGGRTHFAIARHSAAVSAGELSAMDGVEAVAQAKDSHPLVRQQKQVRVGDVVFAAGAPPVFLLGPCSVESEAQVHGLAAQLARVGARFLRGGAYKPRSSPYAFQGHGEPALAWMRAAADAHGLLVVTECLNTEDAERVARSADLVQIGSRNMHNSALLARVAAEKKPILLKRGLAATVEEWLGAGEYCLLHGAPGVIFCERGVRSFDDSTRNLLDLGAVALMSHVLGQPVVVDPSHATGRRDLLLPMTRAALAAGAAGVMLETHAEPGKALSDGPQAIPAADLPAFMKGLSHA